MCCRRHPTLRPQRLFPPQPLMVEKYLSRSKHTWAYAVLFYRHSSLVYVWETHTLYITYTTHHTRTLYAEASHYFFFSLYFPVFKLITITFCNGIKKKNHWKLKKLYQVGDESCYLRFQNVVTCLYTPSDMAWVLFKNVPIFKDKMDVLSIWKPATK